MSQQDYSPGTPKSYITGFVLSLGLTLSAYFAVVNEWLTSRQLLAAIFLLAITQLVVQLVYFLHLGRESKPRWNLTVFSFMLLVLLIVVVGSLWIMHNLDYNVMPPEQLELQLLEDEGIRR